MDLKTPLFQAKNICKDFILPHGQQLHVLDQIDIEVYPQEIVAIIGPSGCGKSTLLRIMIGLIDPTSGERFYRGEPQTTLLPYSTMVFQNFALYPWMTVQENISAPLKALGISAEEREKKTKNAISLIGLTGFEGSYPREISGGMKQRVGLARALVCQPELLFMDEPFSAVDAFTAEGLRSEILHIWTKKESKLSSIVLVSHDIKEVAYMADRIYVIESGPGRVRTILSNSIPRPRDYRSPDFLRLVDELHDMYSSEKPSITCELPSKKPITPLLPVLHDEILGFLQYLHSRGDAQDLYQIGAESDQKFDQIIITAEAAEMLNFIDISHKMATLTEIGKKYLLTHGHERKHLWRDQLLTIPLFIKTQEILLTAPGQTVGREQILQLLIKELPHQDAQKQLTLWMHWGNRGELFVYHSKTGTFSAREPTLSKA